VVRAVPQEMPGVHASADRIRSQGLQFVGIAVDQADKVDRFAKDLGLNYLTLIGGYGAISFPKTLGNRVAALPFTIIVDRRGASLTRNLAPKTRSIALYCLKIAVNFTKQRQRT
jgi:peroxiredoxin